MHWVRGCGVDGIQRDQEEHYEKRQEPCVSQTGIGEPVEEGAGATPFRRGLAGLFVCAIELLAGSRVSMGIGMRGRGFSMRTFRPGDVGSIGLTSFIVDMAGALVSPRISTPKAELPRGRTMTIVGNSSFVPFSDSGGSSSRAPMEEDG